MRPSGESLSRLADPILKSFAVRSSVRIQLNPALCEINAQVINENLPGLARIRGMKPLQFSLPLLSDKFTAVTIL
jgi:hypothetical protein